MPDLIIKKTDKIWALQEKVAKSAEDILPQIDLEALLDDPLGYLNEMAQGFLEAHLDEIEAGAKVGDKFARDVMTVIKKQEA